MSRINSAAMDPDTAHAARVFLEGIAPRFPFDHAICMAAVRAIRIDRTATLTLAIWKEASDQFMQRSSSVAEKMNSATKRR